MKTLVIYPGSETNEEIQIKFIDETDYDIDNIIELNKKFYEKDNN